VFRDEHTSIFTVFQRQHVHVRVLTVTHAQDDVGLHKGESTSVSECIKCRSFHENLSIFTNNSTNLLIQISELNELRERLRKAQQSLGECGQSNRRKKNAELSTPALP